MSVDRVPYRCARGLRCSNKVRIDEPVECPCDCHGQAAINRVCSIEGGCYAEHEKPVEPVFEGSPILVAIGLCEACTTRVTRALSELPLDYTELHFLLGSGESGIASDIVVFSKELQVPIRVSVEALQASMVHETQAWAEPVAERLGVDWDNEQMKHCRPGFVLQRAANLLVNGIGVFLGLPDQEYRHHSSGEWVERDGIEGALQLLHLHDMVRFAAGKTKLIHRLPTPCPRCQQKSLVRYNGADVIECESCPKIARAIWSEQDYRRLSLVLADDWGDAYVPHERQHLVSGDAGTVGSGAGEDAFYPNWPKPRMVDLPESTEPWVAELVAAWRAEQAA